MDFIRNREFCRVEKVEKYPHNFDIKPNHSQSVVFNAPLEHF